MSRPLTRYKIGLAVLGFLTIGFFVIMIVQANMTGQDDRTYRRANQIARNLNDYVDKNRKIPESLATVTNDDQPTDITYRRLSADKYAFCVRYRAASSNLNSGIGRIFSPQFHGYGYYEDLSYYNSYDDSVLYLNENHRAGLNCQTVRPQFADSKTQTTDVSVKPAAFTKNTDGSYTVCGVHTNYFDGEGHVLEGPPTTPGAVSISSNSYPYVGNRLLFMISPASQEFDESCKPLTPADLNVGSTVAVFDITSTNASATSIFLKRSY